MSEPTQPSPRYRSVLPGECPPNTRQGDDSPLTARNAAARAYKNALVAVVEHYSNFDLYDRDGLLPQWRINNALRLRDVHAAYVTFRDHIQAVIDHDGQATPTTPAAEGSREASDPGPLTHDDVRVRAIVREEVESYLADLDRFAIKGCIRPLERVREGVGIPNREPSSGLRTLEHLLEDVAVKLDGLSSAVAELDRDRRVEPEGVTYRLPGIVTAEDGHHKSLTVREHAVRDRMQVRKPVPVDVDGDVGVDESISHETSPSVVDLGDPTVGDGQAAEGDPQPSAAELPTRAEGGAVKLAAAAMGMGVLAIILNAAVIVLLITT